MQTYICRQTDRQAGRQADRQTDRQAGRQTGRQAGRQTHEETVCKIHTCDLSNWISDKSDTMLVCNSSGGLTLLLLLSADTASILCSVPELST